MKDNKRINDFDTMDWAMLKRMWEKIKLDNDEEVYHKMDMNIIYLKHDDDRFNHMKRIKSGDFNDEPYYIDINLNVYKKERRI